MNRKVVAREWLIFVGICFAFFIMAAVLGMVGIDLLPGTFTFILSLYVLVIVARLTIWAVREIRR